MFAVYSLIFLLVLWSFSLFFLGVNNPGWLTLEILNPLLRCRRHKCSILCLVLFHTKGLFTPSESESFLWCLKFFSLISSDCSLIFFAFAQCEWALRLIPTERLSSLLRCRRQKCSILCMVLFHTKRRPQVHTNRKAQLSEKRLYCGKGWDLLKDLKNLQIGLNFFPQKYPVQQIRPWGFNYRNNQTYRPTIIDLENEINKTVSVSSRLCLVGRTLSHAVRQQYARF